MVVGWRVRSLHGAERAVDDHQAPLVPAGAAAAGSKMLKIWDEGWWMVQSRVRAEAEMRLTDGITTRAERESSPDVGSSRHSTCPAPPAASLRRTPPSPPPPPPTQRQRKQRHTQQGGTRRGLWGRTLLGLAGVSTRIVTHLRCSTKRPVPEPPAPGMQMILLRMGQSSTSSATAATMAWSVSAVLLSRGSRCHALHRSPSSTVCVGACVSV